MTIELMYITELVNPGDVQLKVMVLKNVFCAIVSLFIATHGYEQQRIYFVVNYPNINSVQT